MTSKVVIGTVMSVAILLLSGCSGGGSSDASFRGGASIVEIEDCNTTTPSPYTSINNGDALVKDTDITQVEIISNSSNVKKVCVLQGSAHLIR